MLAVLFKAGDEDVVSVGRLEVAERVARNIPDRCEMICAGNRHEHGAVCAAHIVNRGRNPFGRFKFQPEIFGLEREVFLADAVDGEFLCLMVGEVVGEIVHADQVFVTAVDGIHVKFGIPAVGACLEIYR